MRDSGRRRSALYWQRPANAIGRWLIAFLFVATAVQGEPLSKTPVISIIIDDLGRSWEPGLQVVELPGPVACAFLPYASHTRELAKRAHARNKEVILHVPMHSMDHRPLDAGGLTLDMTRSEFIRTFQQDLAAVPHVSGINNHMGSLLTRHPGHMMWLMREVRRHDRMFFVDSRTTVDTVARQVAQETGVPSVARDVFLDPDPSLQAVRHQFQRLLKLAQNKGSATAIGHPYPTTLQVLREELPRLRMLGVRMVPVTDIIRLQQQREQSWQLSSSL